MSEILAMNMEGIKSENPELKNILYNIVFVNGLMDFFYILILFKIFYKMTLFYFQCNQILNSNILQKE